MKLVHHELQNDEQKACFAIFRSMHKSRDYGQNVKQTTQGYQKLKVGPGLIFMVCLIYK